MFKSNNKTFKYVHEDKINCPFWKPFEMIVIICMFKSNNKTFKYVDEDKRKCPFWKSFEMIVIIVN